MNKDGILSDLLKSSGKIICNAPHRRSKAGDTLQEGYIKLFRKIQDHQLWKDKPYSRGQAWVDLLLMANHKESKFLLGNEIISVEPGQIITSEVKLSERWGWSRCRVRAFLGLLQSDSMLQKKSDSKKTVLTLCNYNIYNESETSKKHQKNIKKISNRQRSDTIKNEENEENIEEDKSSSCAEPETDSTPKGYLPLNDGTQYPIYESDIEIWKSLYPAVAIPQAFRDMLGWCIANPKKLKTRVGIKRFINNWLAKEQDKGGRR
jgi:hypothetical protein